RVRVRGPDPADCATGFELPGRGRQRAGAPADIGRVPRFAPSAHVLPPLSPGTTAPGPKTLAAWFAGCHRGVRAPPPGAPHPEFALAGAVAGQPRLAGTWRAGPSGAPRPEPEPLWPLSPAVAVAAGAARPGEYRPRPVAAASAVPRRPF